MSSDDEAALSRALAVLREVLQKLTHGVDPASFEREYARKQVSPGVSVHQFLQQLRLSGSLEESDKWLKLKPEQAVHTPSA